MLIFATMAIEDDSDRIFIENIYHNYFRIMYSTAFKIVEDDSSARDIVHDSIIKLMDKVSLLKEFECCILMSYLVSTVRNISISFVRKRNKYSTCAFNGFDDDLSDSIPDFAPYPIDILIGKDDNSALISAINKIPANERELLISKYFLGKSDMEIGSEIGISPHSVRTYIMRARKKVKRILVEGGSFDEKSKK